MKTINETFEDEDYSSLVKAKGKQTWREFILSLINKEVQKDGVKSVRSNVK